MKFAKFLRTPILKNICERLLVVLRSVERKFGPNFLLPCLGMGRVNLTSKTRQSSVLYRKVENYNYEMKQTLKL